MPPLWGTSTGIYCVTRKTTLLNSVLLGVTTLTMPAVAPAGTAVVSSAAETTVNAAEVPLKVRLLAPVKFVPRILTSDPTFPEVGSVFMNGPNPTDRL